MRLKKAMYNIITNLILQIVTIIYGFVLPKIIISNFGSGVNGLVSSITQFLSYIVLLESGFGPVVKSILYKPLADKDKTKIESILKSTEVFFRRIAIIFVLYIAFLCFFYPMLVNHDFESFYTISLIIIIAIGIFAEYFFGMTYRLFLQADQKMYILSILQIITYILSVILILILAKFGASIHLIKLSTSIIFVIRPLFQNYYVKKKYNLNLKNVKEKYKIKQKWDGLAQHIAGVIHANTDITLITFFCPLVEVSVYSVYYLVVRGIKSLIQSFSNGIDASFGDMIVREEYKNLNDKFHLYEILYLAITSIVFISSIILITPFVTIYTSGVTDVKYDRPLFGFLIVLSEYIAMIRVPYVNLTYSAGHFKETKIGAWLECIINILISIVLIMKLGIIGVAIGTIVAMLFRTIEFVYHASKYILKRRVFVAFKLISLLVIKTVIAIFVSHYIPYLEYTSYINWIINSIMVVISTTVIVMLFDLIIYKKEYIKLRQLVFKFKKA